MIESCGFKRLKRGFRILNLRPRRKRAKVRSNDNLEADLALMTNAIKGTRDGLRLLLKMIGEDISRGIIERKMNIVETKIVAGKGGGLHHHTKKEKGGDHLLRHLRNLLVPHLWDPHRQNSLLI